MLDERLDALLADAPRRSVLMIDSGKAADDGGCAAVEGCRSRVGSGGRVRGNARVEFAVGVWFRGCSVTARTACTSLEELLIVLAHTYGSSVPVQFETIIRVPRSVIDTFSIWRHDLSTIEALCLEFPGIAATSSAVTG